MMKILMVAAEPMEYSGILARASGVRPAGIAADWSRFATLSGNQFLLIANGAGARRAAAATRAGIPACPESEPATGPSSRRRPMVSAPAAAEPGENRAPDSHQRPAEGSSSAPLRLGAEHPPSAQMDPFRPDAIVSTGFCGALSPSLAIADIVAADSVTAGSHRYPALPPRTSRPHHAGSVACIDHVARTAAEKRELHAGGGIAVEMEAAGVAACAAAAGIPFYCIRAVSDLAGEDLANDFNMALREDGHFATMRILIGTLRDPVVRLKELVRLRNRCARAARVLGDFIADCRF